MKVNSTIFFTSSQYGVSESHLLSAYGDYDNCDSFCLHGVKLAVHGYGHYELTATFKVDERDIVVSKVTSDMHLVGVWKSGMKDLYDDSDDDYYDGWDNVVSAMLGQFDIYDKINDIKAG